MTNFENVGQRAAVKFNQMSDINLQMYPGYYCVPRYCTCELRIYMVSTSPTYSENIGVVIMGFTILQCVQMAKPTQNNLLPGHKNC